jgi:hypothetical protein
MTNKLLRGVLMKVYVYKVSPTGDRELVKVVER